MTRTPSTEVIKRVEWLRNNPHLNRAQAAKALGITRSALGSYCTKYKIKLAGARGDGLWHLNTATSDRLGLIASHSGVMTPTAIADYLGCSPDTIRCFARKHDIALDLAREERPREIDKQPGFCPMIAQLLAAARLGLNTHQTQGVYK